jgi:hypothetical protein
MKKVKISYPYRDFNPVSSNPGKVQGETVTVVRERR